MSETADAPLTDTQEHIYRILREEAVGRQNAIPSSALGRRVGITDSNGNPETRFAIRDLMEATNAPIGSCADGYFIVAKRHELRDCLADLDSRMQGMRDRKRLLHENFEAQGELTTPQQALGDFDGGDGQ